MTEMILKSRRHDVIGAWAEGEGWDDVTAAAVGEIE